jgi:hypothetical protein
VPSLPTYTPQPHPQMARETSYKPGHPGGPGRPRGSRNRLGGDLRQQIYNAAVKTGYIEIDKEGNRVATGKGGCQGWLEWLYVNEPKTALMGGQIP